MASDTHTPGSTRIRIRIKGPDFRLADQAAAEVTHSVTATGVRVLGPLPLPSSVEALRASASYDELRCHHRLLEVIESKPQTIDALRRLNLPAGIEIAVVAPDEPVEPAAPEPGAAPAKRNRRRDNRVAAMQFLYSWETQRQGDLVTALYDFFSEQAQDREYYAFAEELIHGVLRDQALIDEVIVRFAQNWAFERVAKVDLATLRLAIFELMRRTDIPPVVTINEAIDIAKVFSTEESKRFVNGILDRYKATLGRDPRKAEGA
jgi:N utilization substance protein B